MAEPVMADKAAELALLGTIMLDPDRGLEACRDAGITADSFYFSDHARLFTVLVTNLERGQPADFVSVGFDAPDLRGLAYDAVTETPSFVNALAYASRVAELAERRRMMAVAEQIATAAASGDLDKVASILATTTTRTKARKKTRYTLAELLTAEFPDPTWLVPGLVPAGMVVLAGRPKLGKSWLALQLASAAASGGKFLDIDVPRCPVLYVALEDSPRRIRDRITLQRTTEGAIDFEFDFPLLSDEHALLTLERLRAEHGYQLIVIDTMARALGKIDQNDQAAVGLIIGQLQRWAIEHDLCLLFVDHHKKPSATVNDLVNDVLGATSKTAVADAVMGLYRQRGQRDATLKITGRDLADRELVVAFDNSIGSWVLRGDANLVVNGEKMQQLIDALATLGEATHRELYEVTGQDKSNSFARIQELVARGIVKRTNSKPVRFSLANAKMGG